jgi:hypothetical protein
MPSEPHSFAYLFERFPSFVQTFVYREAVEMVGQGMNPWLVSIRKPEEPGDLAERLDVEVFYAAEEKELRAEVDARRERRELPWSASRAIPRHRRERDSQRMFEAIWLAPLLRERFLRDRFSGEQRRPGSRGEVRGDGNRLCASMDGGHVPVGPRKGFPGF